MKLLNLLILISILVSCASRDSRETIISDYVQRKGNVKTDMNFRLIKIDELPPIMKADSLKYYEVIYLEAKEKLRNSFSERIKWNQGFIIEYQKNNLMQNEVNDFRHEIALLTNFINYIEVDSIENIDLNKTVTPNITIWRESLNSCLINLNKIKTLNEQSGDVIANKVRVYYSIINPLLNNVKQEIDKTLLFSPDNTQITGEIFQ